MPILNDAAQVAQAMLGLSTQTGQVTQDGSPPNQVTPPNSLPPTPAVGAKPRLADKLKGMETAGIGSETWKLLKEAKSDEDAQDDIRAMLTQTSSKVFTLWMNPRSSEVTVGHSPFLYFAATGKKDPYHRCTILFINDRSERGDPTAYAVPKQDYKKWGGWTQALAVKVDSDRISFFADEDNDTQLYAPTQDEELDLKQTPHAMIVGPKVVLYVLSKRPSAGQLEKWADNELEGEEREQIAGWAELASQTKRNDTSPRPSSILAHDFEAILHPSKELDEKLKDHLDSVLGKAAVVPQMSEFQGGNGASRGQESSQQSKESWKEFAAALTESKKPKSKLTDELKATLAGYWGSQWDAPRNKEVKARWIELDEKRGNKHSLMKIAKKHLAETAQELGIKPRGQILTYPMLTEMLNGDFTPL